MAIFADPHNRRWFMALYKAGYTDKEIGERMSINAVTVGAHRRSLELPGNGGTGYGGYRVNNTTRAGRKPTPGKVVG